MLDYYASPSLNSNVGPLEYHGNERQWRAACGQIAQLTKYDPIAHLYRLMFDRSIVCFDLALATSQLREFCSSFEYGVDKLLEQNWTNRTLAYRYAIVTLLDLEYERICKSKVDAKRPSSLMTGTGLDGRYDRLVKTAEAIKTIFSDLGMRKQP